MESISKECAVGCSLACEICIFQAIINVMESDLGDRVESLYQLDCYICFHCHPCPWCRPVREIVNEPSDSWICRRQSTARNSCNIKTEKAKCFTQSDVRLFLLKNRNRNRNHCLTLFFLLDVWFKIFILYIPSSWLSSGRNKW